MQSIIQQVNKVLGDCAGHGMDHIFSVLSNAKQMISCNKDLTPEQITIISLASILHDVDDHKFFENTSNAKNILQNSDYSFLAEEVLFCIECVSYSSNRNEHPKFVPFVFDKYGFDRCYHRETGQLADKDLWILYPRFADRLEAIDLERALEFGRSRNRQDFNHFTPILLSESDFNKIDFDEMERKYISRNCKAHPEHNTSMDHVYEKCMNLYKMQTSNLWCESEKSKKHIQLKNDIMKFWKNATLMQ